jgi:hypothetical protein
MQSCTMFMSYNLFELLELYVGYKQRCIYLKGFVAHTVTSGIKPLLRISTTEIIV